MRDSTTPAPTAARSSRPVRRVLSAAALAATLILGSAGSSASAQPPDHSAATRDAMEPMMWWVGRWEGKGWSITPDRQRLEVDVVEVVESKIAGQVLVFEGIGTEAESGQVGHHALGTLSFDGGSGEFKMRTYRDGTVLDPEVEIHDDGTLTWGFAQGAGRIRFRIEHTEDDRWVETGEYSPDGEQWFPMLGMDLQRIATDDE